MRAAGRDLLPQHDQESDRAYDDRLNSAVLFNMTRKILNSWVGKPFSSQVVMGETMPDRVKRWGEDIDLQGNNFSVFLRRWFQMGTSFAFSHVLVDMPRTRPNGDRPRTIADDIAEDVRPYWVLIDPRNVIDARATIVEGQERLTHLRIAEVVKDHEGFAERFFPQIRTYDADLFGGPTRVRLYRQPDPDKDEWAIHDEWELGVNFIPLVTFYSDREDLMRGTSPLLEPAELNLRHWQSTSDQIAVLTVARFPILAMSGAVDEDDVLRIGPRQWLNIQDPQGRAYYVEHSGRAIASGRQELLDLEEQMATYGVEMLRRRPTNVTATGRILDDREATSPLEDMAIRFNDAANLALAYTAIWASIPTAGTLRTNTEFSMTRAESSAFEAIREARRERDISRSKYLHELRRLGALDEEFDFEENLEELASEQNFREEPVGETT